jgi:hypothetical protein
MHLCSSSKSLSSCLFLLTFMLILPGCQGCRDDSPDSKSPSVEERKDRPPRQKPSGAERSKEAEFKPSTEKGGNGEAQGEHGASRDKPSAEGNGSPEEETKGGGGQSGGRAPNGPEQDETSADTGPKSSSDQDGDKKPNESKSTSKLDLDVIASLRKLASEEERAGKAAAAYRKLQEAWNLARGHTGAPKADALAESLQDDLARLRKRLNAAGNPLPNKPILVR